MEYMLSIVVDESAAAGAPGLGEPGFAEAMAGWAEYNRMLMSEGHWIAGGSLAPSETATTVRLGGEPRVSDGPYVETKEVLGGFYVVAAADLDEALRLAQAIPMPGAVVEVRPMALRPDASGAPAAVAP